MINFNYKKYILLLLVILLPFLFSSCFKANITAAISTDFIVSYRGYIEIDLKKYDNSQHAVTQETLLKLTDYWRDIGFESEVQIEGGIYHAYFQKQKQCTSYEECFSELFKMMTDEYSPFKSLSYDFTKYENYNEYGISGEIDLQQILDIETLSDLPDDIQKTIINEIEEIEVYIVFDIPNHSSSSVSTSSDAKYAIIYNEITSFNYAGKIGNGETQHNNTPSNIDTQYYNTINYILGTVLLVFIVLIIITIVKISKFR